MLTRAEDVWVLRPALDCKSDWKKGQHLLISDGFELEPNDFDFWEKYKNDPEFSFLKQFSEEVGGKVVTSVIHEDSALAEVEGDLIQEEVKW